MMLGRLIAPVSLLAIVATLAVLAIQIVLAIRFPEVSGLKVKLSVCAAIEFLVLASLTCLSAAHFWVSSIRISGVWVKPSLILLCVACLISTIVSATALATLGRTAVSNIGKGSAETQITFTVPSTAVLVIALATQWLFLGLMMSNRAENAAPEQLEGVELETRVFQSKAFNYGFKSIPYTQTKASSSRPDSVGGVDSLRSQTPWESPRSSLTYIATSSTGKGKQHSPKETRSESPSKAKQNDTFDVWHDSTVDAINRKASIDRSSNSQDNVEHTEGAPSTSSQLSPFDVLAPPPPIRRSLSFASISTKHSTGSGRSSPGETESHIHPLFRSDSATPPPTASPGTRVLASPNMGPVIMPRSSFQSLRQAKSGSLRRGPSTASPLSRQSSFTS